MRVSEGAAPAVRAKGLSVFFGGKAVLDGVDLELPREGISVIIGRSGSGKTTFLRSLDRLNEEVEDCRTEGQVEIDLGEGLRPLYPCAGRAPVDLAVLRRRVGMVFQTPQVFPVSVKKNLALPLAVAAGCPRSEMDDRIRAALEQADLWKEVGDRLDLPAMRLSGGQQQRLCLARALALEPSMLLLDEPTASLDVHAARHVEELMAGLAEKLPVVMVSHSLGQSLRLARTLVVMRGGRVSRRMDDTEGLDERMLEEFLVGTGGGYGD